MVMRPVEDDLWRVSDSSKRVSSSGLLQAIVTAQPLFSFFLTYQLVAKSEAFLFSRENLLPV
jgi:hypothetical protein